MDCVSEKKSVIAFIETLESWSSAALLLHIKASMATDRNSIIRCAAVHYQVRLQR